MTKNPNNTERAKKSRQKPAAETGAQVQQHRGAYKVRHKVRAMVGANGETVVKTIVTHPMETGFRRDKKTGKRIPAFFIQEFMVKHKGRTILLAYWGPAISKNPLLHFTFNGGASGDQVQFFWKDNRGNSGSYSTTVI